MAILNLLIGLMLILLISAVILIMQLLEVVEKCCDSLQPNTPPRASPVTQIRCYESLPPYLKRRLETRINQLPPDQQIEYALAIAAEWDTEDLACVVVQLPDDGGLILGMRPYPQ